MLTAQLFPELDDASHGELVARFGDQSSRVFEPLMNYFTTPLCDFDESKLRSAGLLPDLNGSREGIFLGLLLPIAAAHLKRVDDAVSAAGLGRVITQQASQTILSALVQTALRTVIGLLHEMAAAGQLAGADPQERFADFERQLATRPVQLRLQDDYPLLMPTLHQVAERSANNIVQLLQDLVTDEHRLREAGMLTAPVVALDIDAGDTHAGGRSVAILRLADDCRIVHKPRSLAVDVAYNRFLDRVNDVAGTHLMSVPTLDCGDHGWAAFIDTSLPDDQDGEDRYFEQIGQLLAVAHVLGAADLHQENLVCHGDRPVLVDLETIMHPRVTAASPEGDTALDDLEDGVSATGLLPFVVVHGERAADVGALGSSEDVMSPYKSLVVRNPGRDDMEAVLEHVPMPAAQPTPTIPDDDERAVSVCHLIQRGFETVYTAMMAHRDVMVDEVLDGFAPASVRLIVNQTATYAQLLRMATHPLLFRDSRLRLGALQRIGLWGGDARVGINRAELRDLAEGDIPSFTVGCEDTTVIDSRGVPTGEHVRIAPAQAAARRIREMDRQHLDRQLWRLSAVLVGRFPVPYERTGAHSSVAGPEDGSRAARDLVRVVADDLVGRQRAGLLPGSPATWVGPRLDHEVSGWLPDVLLADLYAGTLGPAMFLAHAYSVTADPAHARAAQRVLDPLARQLSDQTLIQEARRTQRVGVYSGLAGVYLALAVASEPLDRPDWRAILESNLDSLAGELSGSENLDHLDGAAGVLALSDFLSRGATPQGSAAALRLATTCHARLHESIAEGEAEALLRYGGYAHGISGTATALARATVRFGLSDGGLDAHLVALLETFWDPELKLYRATRESPGAPAGWCHGVVGIAFGHVVRARHGLPEASNAERDLRRAAELILSHGLGTSLCYCHGDVGNAEILTAIADCLQDARLASTARRIGSHLVRDILPRVIADRHNRNAHSPGVMLGTSGAGWFALRLLDPERVPDLLSLDWGSPARARPANQRSHP